MIIQHNLSALNSYKNLKTNKNKFSKNMERLSSGFKINRAGDDAAGLSISEGLRALINGTKQAESNTQDGVSLIHTAEGAMQEIQSMLQRSYQLSIASANGTYEDRERQDMQSEIDELTVEIDRIASSTNFNGIQLLKGRMEPGLKPVEVAVNSELPSWVATDQSMTDGFLVVPHTTEETYKNGTKYNILHSSGTLDFSALDTPASGANINDLEGRGFYTTCFTCDRFYSIRFVKNGGDHHTMTQDGLNFIYEIDIDNVHDSKDLVEAIIAGTENGNPNGHYTKLEADETNPGKLIVYDDRSSVSAPGGATDYDGWSGWDNSSFNINHTTCPDNGRFGSGVMVTVAGEYLPAADIIFQIGPSASETMDIDLPYITTWKMGLSEVSVLTQNRAMKSIDTLKHAIDFVSQERGRMGAYENGLEHAYNVLTTGEENLTAAESRIRDTDMAKEVTDYTKNNILLQAAQSMMAQANASSEIVLGLLQ